MNDPSLKKKLVERGLTAAEAERIVERAAHLEGEARGPGHLSADDVRAGAAEVGIDPRFVDEAMQQLERERAAAKGAAAKRRRLKLVAGAAAAALFVVGALTSRVVLGGRLAVVEQRAAQLDNVLERRRALIPELLSFARASSAAPAERVQALEALQRAVEGGVTDKLEADARIARELEALYAALARDPQGAQATVLPRLFDEMAGARNRIAVERKRYDEAALAYNRGARGGPLGWLRPLTGLPARVPLAGGRP